MKLTIEIVPSNEAEEIRLRCHNVEKEVVRQITKLVSSERYLIGHVNDALHRVHFNDVYYLEAVEQRVFIYCKQGVYESKEKLYQLEDKCSGLDFVRVSKSVVLNVDKITHIKPTYSGRLTAYLDNNEQVVISRMYVPELKKRIGL